MMINIAKVEKTVEETPDTGYNREPVNQLADLASFYDQKKYLSLEETLDIRNIRRQIVENIYQLLGDEWRANPSIKKIEHELLENINIPTKILVSNFKKNFKKQNDRINHIDEKKLESDMLHKLESIKQHITEEKYEQLQATIRHNESLINQALLFEIALQTIGPIKAISSISRAGSAKGLLMLGFSDMATGMIATGGSYMVRPASLLYFTLKRGDYESAKMMWLPIISDIYIGYSFIKSNHPHIIDIYAIIKMCLDEEDGFDSYEKNREFAYKYTKKRAKKIEKMSQQWREKKLKGNTAREEYYYSLIKRYFAIRSGDNPISSREKERLDWMEEYEQKRRQESLNGKNGEGEENEATSSPDSIKQESNSKGKRKHKLNPIKTLVKYVRRLHNLNKKI